MEKEPLKSTVLLVLCQCVVFLNLVSFLQRKIDNGEYQLAFMPPVQQKVRTIDVGIDGMRLISNNYNLYKYI